MKSDVKNEILYNENKSFRFNLTVDSKTKSVWKMNPDDRLKKLFLVGIPLSLVFIGIVIAA